jgi:small GTP-binding protein
MTKPDLSKSHELLATLKRLGLSLATLDDEDFFHFRNGLKLTKSGNVEGLNLAHCKIDDSGLEEIIDSIPDGKDHLRYLILSGNDISRCGLLSSLINLEYIDLSWNKIEDIDFLRGITNLRVALLMNNRITHCSNFLFDLRIPVKLQNDFKEGIFLQGNPLQTPPKEIFINNVAALKYFKPEAGAFTDIREMRVILIGSGGAGKTSLANRMLGRPIDPQEPPTENITIRKLTIGDCSVSLWDFAGQESMLSVHRFFLSERSMYVLVLDCRREETADSWLNYIKSIAPEAPIIVVLNKVDENSFHDLDRAMLHRQFANIIGFYRISSVTQQGVDEYLRDFEAIVTGDKRAAMKIPREWNVARHQLLEKLDRYLSKDDCETVFKNAGFSASEVDEFLEFSHNVGFLFRANVPAMDVVCRPQWLVNVVYPLTDFAGLVQAGAITDDRNTGRIRIMNLRNAFPKIYNQDVTRIAWSEVNLVLELMEKFGLCCKMTFEEIFVPELLGHETPATVLGDLERTDALSACWTYEYLPKYIIHRLQIEFRGWMKEGSQWAKGFAVDYPALECEGLITIDEKHQRLVVKLWKGNVQSFFKIIRSRIAAINGDLGLKNLKEGIILAGEHIVDIEELEGLQEIKEEFYVSGRLRKKFAIGDLLSQYGRDANLRAESASQKMDQMRMHTDRSKG